MKHLLAVLWLALVALATPAAAQTFPENNGSPVVEQAGILTPAQIEDLKSKSQALYAQSGRAFAIATVSSLQGYPIDDYSYRLLRYWKLGSAKNSDGVLLVVAPKERKVWISTGYGAGEYMTDAMSGLIIRDAIIPHFKQNDYGGGIEAGADAIIKQMSLPPDEAQKNVTAAGQAQHQRQRSGGNPLPFIFWLFVIGFVILSHFRRGRGRRYRHRDGSISPWVVLWGLNELSRSSRRSSWDGGSSWGGGGGGWGGGGGGGFGGFGGGSGGGGGAGGSW